MFIIRMYIYKDGDMYMYIYMWIDIYIYIYIYTYIQTHTYKTNIRALAPMLRAMGLQRPLLLQVHT